MKFKSIISSFGENSLGWEHHISIPTKIYDEMILIAPDKRIKAVLNKTYDHYCAMMSAKGQNYILINKSIIKQLNLKIGDEVEVELEKQELKYGIPICKEMEEVLALDEEGSIVFHKLTLGNQRSLIHLINKYKSEQLRIERSIILLRLIVESNGNLDYKVMMTRFKEGL